MLNQLRTFVEKGVFRSLDWHFARFICEKDSAPCDELLLAACLISRAVGDGHICIDLKQQPEKIRADDDNSALIALPAPLQWIERIRKCSLVGEPGMQRPLIIDVQGRLYLHRYWQYQDSLAQKLAQQACAKSLVFDYEQARLLLDTLFDETESPDWQKVAAALALLRPLTVISGGPGTGKTSTVVKILALLQSLKVDSFFKIRLAAPTGKAANRLTESIKEKRSGLECSESVRENIPAEVMTIHRLLGARPGEVQYRHNRDNPLDLDVLVVDEASMVDLPMMSKLFEACLDHSRVILLGDMNQLSSVEAGSVLADLCQAGIRSGFSDDVLLQLEQLSGLELKDQLVSGSEHGFKNSVIELKKSYRFVADSDIGRLAGAVKTGNTEKAMLLLADSQSPDIVFNPLAHEGVEKAVSGLNLDAFHFADKETINPVEALKKMEQARLLCAHREGEYGVKNLNRILERRLAREGWIDPERTHYHGRPIMITRNDYATKLFNGDVGLIWEDPDSHIMRACFIDNNGELRQISPTRLPPHETVYAMTIHKSQGSEFNDVTIFLPDESSELLTRELFYTAVTRARNSVVVYSSARVLADTINGAVVRDSGLLDAIENS